MAENETGHEEARDQLLRGLVVPEALALSLTTSAMTFLKLLKALREVTSDALLTEKQLEALMMTVDLMIAIGSRLIVYDAESQRFLPGSATATSAGATDAAARVASKSPPAAGLQADVIDWLRQQMNTSASDAPKGPGRAERREGNER